MSSRVLGLHMMTVPEALSEFRFNYRESQGGDRMEGTRTARAAGVPEGWEGKEEREAHTSAAVIARKAQESLDNGLADNVLEHGVREPVLVHQDPSGGRTVHNGYHRMAVAKDTGERIPFYITTERNPAIPHEDGELSRYDQEGRRVPTGREPGDPDAGPPVRMEERKRAWRAQGK